MHVLIRSKGKDLGCLLASHLAEALNAPLVRPYEGEGSYVSTDCVRKAGQMVGNERCLFLCDWLSISPEELTNTVDGYEKPCIWLLDDHESTNSFPAFAVFNLVGMEDTIRQELLEKLTGKTFNAKQCKSIAANKLSLDKITAMADTLKFIKPEASVVSEAASMLIADAEAY